MPISRLMESLMMETMIPVIFREKEIEVPMMAISSFEIVEELLETAKKAAPAMTINEVSSVSIDIP